MAQPSASAVRYRYCKLFCSFRFRSCIQDYFDYNHPGTPRFQVPWRTLAMSNDSLALRLSYLGTSLSIPSTMPVFRACENYSRLSIVDLISRWCLCDQICKGIVNLSVYLANLNIALMLLLNRNAIHFEWSLYQF